MTATPEHRYESDAVSKTERENRIDLLHIPRYKYGCRGGIVGLYRETYREDVLSRANALRHHVTR